MTELLYILVSTHITIICVTVYLHRGMTHRGLEFNFILSNFMRFWLWLTTGMVTKEWMAIHRAHHRFSDKQGDPHSPKVFGLLNILFKGVSFYRKTSKNIELVKSYAPDSPNDWIEHNLYTRYHGYGILLLLIVNLLIFNLWGLLIWLVQILWIPFWAAGVINGVGHTFGYRNGHTEDNSKNISPWGIVIGGEELHNNHHLEPANPKMSRRWFEFDIGWLWIKLFMVLKLIKLKS